MNFLSFNKEKKVNAELITLNFSILQFQSYITLKIVYCYKHWKGRSDRKSGTSDNNTVGPFGKNSIGPGNYWTCMTSDPAICQKLSPKIQAVHDSQAIMRISRCGLEIAIAASCTGRLL